VIKFLENVSSSIIAIVIWPIALITFLISVGMYLFVALFIPPKRLHPLARFLSRFVLLGAGQIIKIEGKLPSPENGPYLYLFNHQSLLDQFLFVGTIKEYASAVGANYQFSWLIWGRLIKRFGVIPIVRDDLTKAIHSLTLAENEIRKGTSFLFAPEGTRTRTGKIGVFKKGCFHLALNTGITIIPIGLIGAFRAKKKDDWHIYPGRIAVKIGQPVYQTYYKNMSIEDLRDEIKNRIAILCEDDLIIKHV
jgi:1-acyl-sn-glycerol-3-phosphate acyltransferase